MDGGGELTNALFGELMLAYAARQGVVGLVINGAIRDADAIAALESTIGRELPRTGPVLLEDER